MELLLYTALRRSDMVLVGPDNLICGKLVLHHSKNDSDTVIPLMPALAEAIAPFSDNRPTFLQTSFGKHFTGAGLGNWFRDACNDAGLPQCSAHGLRKAISRLLAEHGATNQQGRAVTGHKTDKEFDHYAAKASRELMAGEAMANLSKNSGEPDANSD